MLTITKDMTNTTPKYYRRIATRDEIERLCKAVGRLPSKERLLFLLYFQYGHTQNDIAILLGVNNGTISRRLRRIAKKIQELK